MSIGKWGSMSWSRCRNAWRRSSPVICGLEPTVVTTTRTVNAYGIVFGRPFDVWAGSPPFSLPANDDGLPGGNSAFSVAVFTCASWPLWELLRWVVPSHQVEETVWKSAVLSGWPPGATSTLQV